MSPSKEPRGQPERHRQLRRLLVVRMTPELEKEIAVFVASVRSRYPFITLTFSDVVRWLLQEGLTRLASRGPDDPPDHPPGSPSEPGPG